MDDNQVTQLQVDDKTRKLFSRICEEHKERGWDPWKHPPDLKQAEDHSVAWRISEFSCHNHGVRSCYPRKCDTYGWMEKQKFCFCCDLPIEGDLKAENYGMCSKSPMDLKHLGSGMTLYYDLLKQLMIIMLLCFLFTFFCLFDNYWAGEEYDWDEDIDNHEFISGTIAGHGHDSPSIAQPWLFAAMGWSIIIYFVYIKIRQRSIKKIINADEKSPADYTLLVSHIPKNATEAELQRWIESRMQSKGHAVTIKKLNFCYNISDFMKYIHKWKQLVSKVQKAPKSFKLKNWGWLCKKNKGSYLDQLAKVDFKLKNHLKQFLENRSFYFVQKAFVTFEFEKQTKDTLEVMLEPHGKKWWHNWLHNYCFSRQLTKEKFEAMEKIKEYITTFTFRPLHTDRPPKETESIHLTEISPQKIPGEKVVETTEYVNPQINKSPSSPKPLKIERPDEPIDILWENLDEGKWLLRKVVSYFCTALVLFVCGIFVFYSAIWQKDLNEYDTRRDDDDNWVWQMLVGRAPVVVIYIMNKILENILPRLTQLEKNISLTQQQANLALKLTISMFLNTSIVTFAMYYDNVWYGKPSLIEDVADIIIVILLIPPIENTLSTILQYKLKKWRERRNLDQK